MIENEYLKCTHTSILIALFLPHIVEMECMLCKINRNKEKQNSKKYAIRRFIVHFLELILIDLEMGWE